MGERGDLATSNLALTNAVFLETLFIRFLFFLSWGACILFFGFIIQPFIWHFSAVTAGVIFFGRQLPSSWSCVTLLFASDSCVSKAFLSSSLFSSCSFRLCSSERTVDSSSTFWFSLTWTQKWESMRDEGPLCSGFMTSLLLHTPGSGSRAVYPSGLCWSWILAPAPAAAAGRSPGSAAASCSPRGPLCFAPTSDKTNQTRQLCLHPLTTWTHLYDYLLLRKWKRNTKITTSHN